MSRLHIHSIAALTLVLTPWRPGHAEPVFFTESELYTLVGVEQAAFDTGQLMQRELIQVVNDEDDLSFPLQASSDADLSLATMGARLLSGGSFLAAMAATTTQLDTLRFAPLVSELTLPYTIAIDGRVLGSFTGEPIAFPPSGSIFWGFGENAQFVADGAYHVVTPEEGVMDGVRANTRPHDFGRLPIGHGEIFLADLFDGDLSEDGVFEYTGSITLSPGMTELAVYMSLGMQLTSAGVDVNFSNAVRMQFDPIPGFSFSRYSQEDFGDDDADGVINSEDNCPEAVNADQRDTDQDNFGNACDPDLDNNCLVDFADLQIYRLVVFTADEDADFDGNGAVDLLDLLIMKNMFFGPPGPGAHDFSCDTPAR